MAITKLMHMKESPGYPHTHLRNAINYVLDVKHEGEKTEYGLWVGGNAGVEAAEVFSNFLETKQEYGKLNGRQGYHFVLSFTEGQTDKETAFSVVKEFCERYLGDSYDYLYALHTDKGHLHGHIIFNSVSRLDGYKYHYKIGDWEKYIQPITDAVCEEHGVEPLEYTEERVGVSYASWVAEKNQRQNWGIIMRADIDFAIQRAQNFQEFQSILQKMNYSMEFKYSKARKASYIVYSFQEPGGKVHRHRSYTLTAGYKKRNLNLADEYSAERIMQRIRTKSGTRSYEKVMEDLSKHGTEYLKPNILKSTRTYNRLYQAVSYYNLPNPFAVPAYRVRRDMIRMDKLLEECHYIKTHQLTSVAALIQKQEQLARKQETLLNERKHLYGVLDQQDETIRAVQELYQSLYHKLQCAGTEAEKEAIEDSIYEMEKAYPYHVLQTRMRVKELTKDISDIRRERRILERIIQTEKEKEIPRKEIKLKA